MSKSGLDDHNNNDNDIDDDDDNSYNERTNEYLNQIKSKIFINIYQFVFTFDLFIEG